MKKLLMLALMLSVSGIAFAGGDKPPRTMMADVNLPACLNNVDVAASQAGLQTPWNLPWWTVNKAAKEKAYYDYVQPLQNACQCKYFNIPWQYKYALPDTAGSWSCS